MKEAVHPVMAFRSGLLLGGVNAGLSTGRPGRISRVLFRSEGLGSRVTAHRDDGVEHLSSRILCETVNVRGGQTLGGDRVQHWFRSQFNLFSREKRSPYL